MELARREDVAREVAKFLAPLGTTHEDFLRDDLDLRDPNYRRDPKIERAWDVAVARANLARACVSRGFPDLAYALNLANVRDQVAAPFSYKAVISHLHGEGDLAGEVEAIEAYLAWFDARAAFHREVGGDIGAITRLVADRAKAEARLEKARAKLLAEGVS